MIYLSQISVLYGRLSVVRLKRTLDLGRRIKRKNYVVNLHLYYKITRFNAKILKILLHIKNYTFTLH